MSDKSNIEWTDATWNPVRGCSRVSAGCMNCYAERVAARFSKPGLPYAGLVHSTTQGPKWTGKVSLHPELLDQPLRWTKPRRIFVNSMSDLFHEAVPDEFILKVFDVMRQSANGHAPHLGGPGRGYGRIVATHTFQILTKRPERMLDFCTRLRFAQNDARGLYLATNLPHNGFNPMGAMSNVWLGVSVEDQASADERIPQLLQTPAAVRFISAEPLLGPVKLLDYIGRWAHACKVRDDNSCPNCGADHVAPGMCDQGTDRVDWIITGGESGSNARPSHPDWFRSLRDQCLTADVPFFFKQWGEWACLEDHRGLGWKFGDPRTGFWSQDRPGQYEWHHKGVASHGQHMLQVGKPAAGRMLDEREWNEFPQ